jgi:SAM-dependent methyltransferase
LNTGLEYLSKPAAVSMGDEWFVLNDRGHFWVRWRFEVLRRRFGEALRQSAGPLLEVGCGNGVFRAEIEATFGRTVDACDLNEAALKLAPPGQGRLMVYDVHERRADLLGRYAGLFLMDVLEHVEDDQGFLESSLAHLEPKGFVLVNVPAHEALFSRYDVAAGHLRRYDRKSLAALLEKAGLEAIDVLEWGFSLLPLLLLRKAMMASTPEERILERGFKPPGQAVNAMLLKLLHLELALPHRILPGTSVMAFARKGA